MAKRTLREVQEEIRCDPRKRSKAEREKRQIRREIAEAARNSVANPEQEG